MAAGPGPTSLAMEASCVELVGSGVKVGRFRANGEEKPFARVELQSPPPPPPPCICSFRAPSCSLLTAPSTSDGRRPHCVRSNGHKGRKRAFLRASFLACDIRNKQKLMDCIPGLCSSLQFQLHIYLLDGFS